MSWTVACFCGTVFTAPANRCPTCHAAVPSVTTGVPPGPSAQLPDAVEELLRRHRRARGSD
jgi:hypothetical protein